MPVSAWSAATLPSAPPARPPVLGSDPAGGLAIKAPPSWLQSSSGAQRALGGGLDTSMGRPWSCSVPVRRGVHGQTPPGPQAPPRVSGALC